MTSSLLLKSKDIYLLQQNDEQSTHKLVKPKKMLNIIIPAYNEEEVIQQVLEELDKELQALDIVCMISVIDDGSTDETAKKVIETKLKTTLTLVRLSRNFGKEIAMTAGLKESATYDAVVIMDADGQHPPHLIKEFIKYWKQGFDDIYATRKTRTTDKWLKRKLSTLFYKLLPKDAQHIKNNAGDFRLLSSKVIQALNQTPEKRRFMKGLYTWVGFKKHSIPYDVRPRFGGETKFSLSALVSFAITGITSFSTFPLQLISRAGFIISSLSIFYGIFILFRTFIFGVDLQGWATLVIGTMFLSGLQLISIGILGTYIGEVFIETKKRPLYFIDEIITKNTDEEERNVE